MSSFLLLVASLSPFVLSLAPWERSDQQKTQYESLSHVQRSELERLIESRTMLAGLRDAEPSSILRSSLRMSSYGCESVTQGRICDQNHGTPSDPQQVVCGASLVGELCQLCPYHIVCDGGGDVYLPNRVVGRCCNKPGCTKRFIANEACPAKL
ncbi:hypothetical protein AAVH_05848 [Aphelenchoides avenae]|nr:hypothetical protein AAVH_05848 [Aphelenchus avenae]